MLQIYHPRGRKGSVGWAQTDLSPRTGDPEMVGAGQLRLNLVLDVSECVCDITSVGRSIMTPAVVVVLESVGTTRFCTSTCEKSQWQSLYQLRIFQSSATSVTDKGGKTDRISNVWSFGSQQPHKWNDSLEAGRWSLCQRKYRRNR